MTNETILYLLDHLCNEARNAMHAAFGLMDFHAVVDPGWQTRVDASRSSADRLLRTLDDMRELVSGPPPADGCTEEIDLALCVGEIAEALNLASGDGAARLLLERVTEPVAVWQDRPALEQVVTRILQAALTLSRRGVVRVAISAAAAEGARLGIVTPDTDVASQIAIWLNAAPDQLNADGRDLGVGVSLLVAGARLRALGGTADFACEAGAPTSLALGLPRGNEDGRKPIARATVDSKPLQILVAEDSDDSYALTQLLLRGESVDRAHTGLEAIDKIRERRFDVVFMDIHMPGMNGYDSIRAIRDWETQSGNARIPIVILSSDDIGTQTRSAARSGCSGFLRKPVREADLVNLLGPLRATRDVIF